MLSSKSKFVAVASMVFVALLLVESIQCAAIEDNETSDYCKWKYS